MVWLSGRYLFRENSRHSRESRNPEGGIRAMHGVFMRHRRGVMDSRFRGSDGAVWVTFLALFFPFFFLSFPSLAGTFDAREVARINNCTPKKIEVSEQSLGAQGSTVYKVTCTMPKTVDTKGADALLVRCDGSLCELLRPVVAGAK